MRQVVREILRTNVQVCARIAPAATASGQHRTSVQPSASLPTEITLATSFRSTRCEAEVLISMISLQTFYAPRASLCVRVSVSASLCPRFVWLRRRAAWRYL